MNQLSEGILELGFDKSFWDASNQSDHDFARVVAVHKDSFMVNSGKGDVPAEMTGKMMFGADFPIDYPAVGDWVPATFYDDNTLAVIHGVLPRKSLLKRKTPGKRIDFQLIGANIDVAFVVQSLDADFNLRRLERYMVMVKEGRIEPVILLSKSDLLSPQDISDRVGAIHRLMPFAQVHPFSNKTASGLNGVRQRLTPRQTYCVLGSSGVGKTSLLNNLIGEARFATRPTRARDGKGRHATTYRQLIKLDGGAMLIDTPGMRELGHVGVTVGLDDTFVEITKRSEQCRFNDCTHVNETGCAVLQAVQNGQISRQRYQNFIKMHRESLHHEMSYFEKRQKDKRFGKMYKSVMKHKKNRW